MLFSDQIIKALKGAFGQKAKRVSEKTPLEREAAIINPLRPSPELPSPTGPMKKKKGRAAEQLAEQDADYVSAARSLLY